LHDRGEALKGANQQSALTEIALDLENAVAGWHWAVKQARIEQLAQALDGLGLFYLWQNRLHAGVALCQLAVARLAPTLSGEKRGSDGRGASEPQARDAMLAQPDLVRFSMRVFLWLSKFHRHLKQDTSAQQALRQVRSWLGDPSLADHDTRPVAL